MTQTISSDANFQAQLSRQVPSPATPVGLASEALLHQLCDVLAAIVEGQEPFGPLIIQRLPAAADTARREGDQRRKERGREEVTARGGAPADDATSWPQGPLINNRPLGSDSVEQIVTAALADVGASGAAVLGREELRESMRRLGLDGPTVGRVAPPVLVWLAKAGVLAAAEDEGAPWSVPRALTSTDPAAVRLLLRAVETPGQAEIEQERARGLK